MLLNLHCVSLPINLLGGPLGKNPIFCLDTYIVYFMIQSPWISINKSINKSGEKERNVSNQHNSDN